MYKPAIIPYLALHANTQGYPILVGLALVAMLLFRKHRMGVLSVLEAANALVAIAGTISLFLFIPDVFAVPQEDAQRFATLNRWFGPYGWASWLAFVSSWVPLIFWIKRLRKNIVCSILVVIAYNIELLTRFWARFYHDYLPSGWEIKSDAESQAKDWVIYLGMVILTYLIIKWTSRKTIPQRG